MHAGAHANVLQNMTYDIMRARAHTHTHTHTHTGGRGPGKCAGACGAVGTSLSAVVGYGPPPGGVRCRDSSSLAHPIKASVESINPMKASVSIAAIPAAFLTALPTAPVSTQ